MTYEAVYEEKLFEKMAAALLDELDIYMAKIVRLEDYERGRGSEASPPNEHQGLAS